MAEQTPQRCVCGPSGEDIDVRPDCPRHGEQTPQERLAQELRKLAWSDYFDPDTWAAQLLDSDVIREMQSEAHERAVALVCEMVGVPNVNWPNPYLPTCHPRGEKA